MCRGDGVGVVVNTGTTTHTWWQVEDLYHLLVDVKRHFPEVDAVASGAIFSNYQRHRVENVCQRLGFTSVSYLWRREQGVLLREMVENNMHAVLLKVASLGLTRGGRFPPRFHCIAWHI